MTAATFERQRAGPSAVSVAAWALIAAAVLQLVLGIPLASLQAKDPPPWPIPALNAINHLLHIVGVAGLARAWRGGDA